MEKPFIIDSNFFIQAYRINYPFDVVPSFWVKVKELAELCPIISTSLGLSISEVDDNVRISSIEEIFQHLENITQEEEIRPRWI